MYTLISAIGERFDGDSRWAEVQIGDLAVSTIYSTYRNVKAVLSNPFLNHQVALDLADVRSRFGTSPLTFDELLVQLGNEALPTSDTLPELKTRYAQYRDAVRAGYKVQPIHPIWAADAEMPPADRTWVHLSRPNTDYQRFGRYCMVSVNGFWHCVEVSDEGIYVKEANKSRTVSGHNTVGILDFERIGALSYVPITPEMVYLQKAGQALRHRAYLDLGQDVSNKIVLLVLGGYLHVLDTKTFWRVGAQSVAVSMENLPLMERYHESGQTLDLSSLPLQRSQRNEFMVNINDFLSDDNLRAYLSLPQSFAVILDCPNIFVDHYPVHTSKIPGGFVSYIKPQWPLIAGYGMSPNYWSTYEDRQWSLTCANGYLMDNPLYHTVDLMQQQGVSDARIPENRQWLSPASFLRIGRDI